MFYLGYGRRVMSLEDPLCVEHDKVEECECCLPSPWKFFSPYRQILRGTLQPMPYLANRYFIALTLLSTK
jgi:hypothetical protein